MKSKDSKVGKAIEPVGIVISGMPTPPSGTVFTAYMYGPAPASSTEKEGKAA